MLRMIIFWRATVSLYSKYS